MGLTDYVKRAMISSVANPMLSFSRAMGRGLGGELAVQVDDNEIKTTVVDPKHEDLAWDDDLYRRGNLFYRGYANPIKPVVQRNKELENTDEIDIDGPATTAEDGDGLHTSIMSSKRFGAFMRQKIISEMLRPREQWKIIIYALIALVLLQVVTVMSSLAAAGVF